MRLGVHQNSLIKSLQEADKVVLYQPDDVDWNMDELVTSLGDNASLYRNIDKLVANVLKTVSSGDQLLVMSNGGFGGIHDKLLQGLQE